MSRSLAVVVLILTVSAFGQAAEPELDQAEESGELRWRDPVPEYTPDLTCAGDCMVHWVSDTVYGAATPIPPRKPRWPPLFDLLRDLFKRE